MLYIASNSFGKDSLLLYSSSKIPAEVCAKCAL